MRANQYVDEFREWMVYLASRNHVIAVSCDLYMCLFDEICGCDGNAPVAIGYPRLVELALLHAAVGRPSGVAKNAERPFWQSRYEREWRQAAAAAARADPDAWGERFSDALMNSRRFVARIAYLRKDAAPNNETMEEVSAAADALFQRMWARRALQISGEKFRSGFCQEIAPRRGREGAARAFLARELMTFLRDGGSHTLVEPERGNPGAPKEPWISGNRVKLVTRFLSLSSQLILQHQIERVLALAPAHAETVAECLLAARRHPEEASILRNLAALIVQRTAVLTGVAPRTDVAQTLLDRDEIVQRVRAMAEHMALPPRDEEIAHRPEHATALLALCRRQRDKELPQTLEQVERWSSTYRGRAASLIGIDTPVSSAVDGTTLGDRIVDKNAGSTPANPLAEALGKYLDDPGLVQAALRAIDRIFVTDAERIRGALLLGLPYLVPANALKTVRDQAEKGAPTTDAAWNRLARQLGTDAMMLRLEAADLMRRLATAFAFSDDH